MALLPPEVFSKAVTDKVLLDGLDAEQAQPIAWAGGDCPLPPQTLVQIQCVFESEFDYFQPPRRAGAWERRWNRDHGDLCGITHYVLVER
ncbi:hypothetical protein [Sphingomonas sp. PAMC 26621]|uniref:hypothetical protein n=1 Tax=Sphingomonas sp. PAMC 26621 TaxID=1112213 RepID=UPI0011112C4F|nr:hypothetical protein [Sphingomonas sp. PAMC 26621]